MMVGTKSIATLSSGYLNALDYAKQRVQGADLTQQADKTAPRVTITHHPDVRRSLMLQKAYAEGLRALVLYTATQQDAVEAAQLAAGSEELPEDSPAQLARRVNDLLLPVVKGSARSGRGCCSAPSRCRRSAGPGSSRTTRSSSTSATPRSTPSTRARPPSRASTSSSARSSRTRASRSPTWPCRSRSSPRTSASAAVRSTRSASCSARPSPTCRPSSSTSAPRRSSRSRGRAERSATSTRSGSNTSRLLLSAGDLVVGWLLLREAEVAHEALDAAATALSAKDRDFYTGKVAAARFYARNVLPSARGRAGHRRGHRRLDHGRARVGLLSGPAPPSGAPDRGPALNEEDRAASYAGGRGVRRRDGRRGPRARRAGRCPLRCCGARRPRCARCWSAAGSGWCRR